MNSRRMGVAAVVLMACTVLLTMRAYAQDYPVTTGVLYVSTTTPTAGDTITATGGGCAPGGTVTFTIDGQGTIATATADAAGDFDADMVVPVSTGGETVDVDATCGTSNGGTQVLTETLEVTPLLTGVLGASTNAPIAGGVISVSGSGCAPSEAVTIAGGGTQLGSTTADANGDFITTVTIPSVTGTLTVTATCSTGSETQVLGVTLTVQAPPSNTTANTATNNTATNNNGENLAFTGRTMWATTAVASALGLAGITLILIGRRTRND